VKRTALTMFAGLFTVMAKAVNYGAYDFAETMGNRALAIEETFVNQRTAKGLANATEERSLYDLCMSFKSKGRMPLVTIEPRSGGHVLQKVATGKCDTELGVIAAHLRAYGGPAIIRWGQEAENRLYPWGGRAPGQYIAAYRYVAGYLRSHLPGQKLSFCWSPVGSANCVAYHPGDFYVDYVGCSLYWTRGLAHMSYHRWLLPEPLRPEVRNACQIRQSNHNRRMRRVYEGRSKVLDCRDASIGHAFPAAAHNCLFQCAR
jgi:hypothetical protein